MVVSRLICALGGALGGALVMHLAQGKPAVRRQPGRLTPARVAVHGDLMSNCNDPKKLQRGAALFGAEGLPDYAEALMRKAVEIHEMMHGARSIVERCRAGDQHAMAMAKGIGDQSRAGNKRAQLSAFFIAEYTKAYPNLDEQYFDQPPPEIAQAAAVPTVVVPAHTVEPSTIVSVPAHAVPPATIVSVPATPSSPPAVVPAHTVEPSTIVSVPAHAVPAATMVAAPAHAVAN